MGALGVTPYIDRALEVLELAERGNDNEHRALVIARDGTVAAMALFGEIAGTANGAKLHTAVLAPGVRAEEIGPRLMGAVVEALRKVGAKFLLAELPEDPAFENFLPLRRHQGLGEKPRFPAFSREGTPLSSLRPPLKQLRLPLPRLHRGGRLQKTIIPG